MRFGDDADGWAKGLMKDEGGSNCGVTRGVMGLNCQQSKWIADRW